MRKDTDDKGKVRMAAASSSLPRDEKAEMAHMRVAKKRVVAAKKRKK